MRFSVCIVDLPRDWEILPSKRNGLNRTRTIPKSTFTERIGMYYNKFPSCFLVGNLV